MANLSIPMRLRTAYLHPIADSLRSSETVGPILFAVSIGMGAGLASILFRRMISLVHAIFFVGIGNALSPWFGVAVTIPLVALGGLLVGLVTKYFAPETKGHGVPEVMYAVAMHGGRIRPRVAVFRAIASALCIGSGGSAGREGPIVQIGSALGSALAQWFRFPDRRVILSVACGAAGGVAATFNAPIAGVIFALEVVLGRFTALSFGLVVLSSATATVVSHLLSIEGDAPAFKVLSEYKMTGTRDLLLFLLLGALCAIASQIYTRVLYAVEDVADRAKIPDILKPVIGGALVGVIAIWRPEVMGTNYETIEHALNNQMLVKTLFVLAFAKIASTALTIGSGGSGGVFAPALFVGAMFGGGYGTLVHTWFPECTSPPGAYALVGMAAVFAGAAHAPVTAILILFEMTDNYPIIVPLMSATVVTTFIARKISPDSIYTMKLKRRGINLGRTQEVNLMDAVTVGDAMVRNFRSVAPDLPVTELIKTLTRLHETGCLVIDAERRLVGVVTMHDVENKVLGLNPHQLTADDVCTRNVIVCRPDQTLSRALAQFGARNFAQLPVIDPDRPDHVIGILNRSSILMAYAKAYEQSDAMLPKAEVFERLDESHAMVVNQIPVSSGSALADTYVRDAGFPLDCVLGAVLRGHATLLPRGSTRIIAGDELVILTTRDNADTIRDWLRDRC